MKRSPLEIVAIVLGVGLVIWLTLARQAELNKRQPSYFSSYDTGRNGYRALYEMLYREGVPVTRFEHQLGLLDPDVGTIVYSSPALELAYGHASSPVDASDIVRLRNFVRAGGRLVLLDNDYGGVQDAKLGLPSDHDVALATGAGVVADVVYTAGVGRVEAPITQAFAMTNPKATPLLSAGGGLAAIAYPLGKGEVIAITAPELFGNAHLASADNARFAFDVLAGHGTVAFDERVHGYDEDQSFWSALPTPVRVGIFIVVAVVLLALIGANVRFAPALTVEPARDRDSSAYLTSMGSLLRRAHAARAAIAAFTEDALRRARRRYGLASTAGLTDIVARIDREETRRAIANLDRLNTLDHPSDAELLRAAVLSARLRKDLA